MDEKKEVILKLENICQSYVVGNDVKDAVDNVSLEVYDNEFLVVLGPGHCGKTVLMNTIAGIEKPIGGKIFLEGEEVHGSDSRIGMVFQSLDLMFWQTVMGNVEFGLRLQGVKKEERRKVAQKYIDLVRLTGFDAEWVGALPTALMKPLSGSGARGMMVDAMQTFGADSFAGRLSCIFQGSTDTTFYILAVYFGSVGVSRTRHAVGCGLAADLAGMIAAVFIAYLFF